MCEASFPGSVTQEDFELHVMEHFNFEETETIRYIPPTANMPNGNEFENNIDSAGSSWQWRHYGNAFLQLQT